MSPGLGTPTGHFLLLREVFFALRPLVFVGFLILLDSLVEIVKYVHSCFGRYPEGYPRLQGEKKI